LAQPFPRWFNKLPLVSAVAGLVLPVVATAGIWYYGSPKFTDVGYRPVQPVPYSHKLHVGDMGMDWLNRFVSPFCDWQPYFIFDR